MYPGEPCEPPPSTREYCIPIQFPDACTSTPTTINNSGTPAIQSQNDQPATREPHNPLAYIPIPSQPGVALEPPITVQTSNSGEPDMPPAQLHNTQSGETHEPPLFLTPTEHDIQPLGSYPLLPTLWMNCP